MTLYNRKAKATVQLQGQCHSTIARQMPQYNWKANATVQLQAQCHSTIRNTLHGQHSSNVRRINVSGFNLSLGLNMNILGWNPRKLSSQNYAPRKGTNAFPAMTLSVPTAGYSTATANRYRKHNTGYRLWCLLLSVAMC
jgi:hypothetical protein